MESPRTPRRRDDPLWKAVLEDVFADFLTFYFPDAEQLFDLEKGFVYMDKEFDQLFPVSDEGKGVRYVDKLVKVFLKDGGARYILVHIEVQSQKGKGDLAERMYTYYYRINDKYHVPVTAIAILADGNKSYRPTIYDREYLGTRIRYEFNTYKIIDQDESDLRADPNPFSVVVLTTLLAIKYKNIADEGLKAIKLDLYDEMMRRKMSREERKGIYNFLTYYVRFEDSEMLSIFEQEVEHKQERSHTVGTEQYLLEKAKTEGLERGKREGLERGKREEAIAIAIELKKEGSSVEFIARITKLSIEEIEKL